MSNNKYLYEQLISRQLFLFTTTLLGLELFRFIFFRETIPSCLVHPSCLQLAFQSSAPFRLPLCSFPFVLIANLVPGDVQLVLIPSPSCTCP